MRVECAELHWPVLVSLGSEWEGLNDGGQETVLTRAKPGASRFDRAHAFTPTLILSQHVRSFCIA